MTVVGGGGRVVPILRFLTKLSNNTVEKMLHIPKKNKGFGHNVMHRVKTFFGGRHLSEKKTRVFGNRENIFRRPDKKQGFATRKKNNAFYMRKPLFFFMQPAATKTLILFAHTK